MKKWQLLLCSLVLGIFAPTLLASFLIYTQITFFGTIFLLPTGFAAVSCLLGIVASVLWYRGFHWVTTD